MDYGILIDIYAPFGFTLFEMRDKFKRPLDPQKPGFQAIFALAKDLIVQHSKKTLIV